MRVGGPHSKELKQAGDGEERTQKLSHRLF